MADRTLSSKKAGRRRKKVKTKPKPPVMMPDAAPVPPCDDPSVMFAQIGLNPILQAANTIQKYSKAMDGSRLDLKALVGELTMQVAAVRDGELGRTEGMLIAQAHSLDAIFGNLVRHAIAQEYMPHFETFLRLALKAQTQCRATLETLAAIKNPPIVYARQANVTTGPQQINNGTGAPSWAREIQSEQSKLSGGGNELLPNTGASALEGGVNQKVEALGKIDRAKVARR